MASGMKIEGLPPKPWVLWSVHPNTKERIEKVASADTEEELRKMFKRHLDTHYRIYHNGKPIGRR